MTKWRNWRLGLAQLDSTHGNFALTKLFQGPNRKCRVFMRNTFLWVGRNIFSRSLGHNRGERHLSERLRFNWKGFKFQMCSRNIHFYNTKSQLKGCTIFETPSSLGRHKWTDFFYIVLNLNLCEQASQFVWGDAPGAGDVSHLGEVIEFKQVLMRNPTATREWGYVCGSVGPICDSVQTLCYHYCAALWPHPHSNKAWEKTRTIIVADHPPDTVQCWDFANSVLPLVQVKWLNGETGQGSFIVYESVLEFLFVDFLDRLQPSLKSTSD